MTKLMAATALALTLAGCGPDLPVVVGMQIAPAECFTEREAGANKTSRDPVWQQLPDRPTVKTGARTIRSNKNGFAELKRLRAICEAGLRGA